MDAPVTEAPPAFVQPKPWLRWIAVALAAAGWYVSLQSFRVSAKALDRGPFMRFVCGGSAEAGEVDSCTAVLTAPQAYVALSRAVDGLRIPVSTFGLGYFAFLFLWFLLIGPPAYHGRVWHLIAAVILIAGAWQSLRFIGVMAFELHMWCVSCLVAHALNGGLLVLAVMSWPWRPPKTMTASHPSARLALATALAGGLLFIAHFAFVYINIAGTILTQKRAEYARVLSDPAFIVWNFNRQPVAAIPLRDDEVFEGDLNAANTIVVFSDFQCRHCRQAHEMLATVLEKYPARARIALRHYPQDAQCNANERFRMGGHESACRAAQAAEAARIVGGARAFRQMCHLLYTRQHELPKAPLSAQSPAQQSLFETWATEIGLDSTAFAAAMTSPDVTDRIQADITVAEELGLQNMPTIYLNGRRLLGWTRPETWDALLSSPDEPTTPPADDGPQP